MCADLRVPKRESDKSATSAGSSDVSKRNTMRLPNDPGPSEENPESSRRMPRVDVGHKMEYADAMTSKEQALQRVKARERARERQLSPAQETDTLASSSTPRGLATMTMPDASPVSQESKAAAGMAGCTVDEDVSGFVLPMEPGTFLSALPEAAGISSGSWVRDQVGTRA